MQRKYWLQAIKISAYDNVASLAQDASLRQLAGCGRFASSLAMNLGEYAGLKEATPPEFELQMNLEFYPKRQEIGREKANQRRTDHWRPERS